jgi:PPOX class probable F420-dependent enzyme
MDLDVARDFLREHHRAVLHTFRSDGSPQLSPVLVGVDAEGRAVVSANEGKAKTENLERDPRASLCVFTDAFFGAWARVDGTTEVLHLPDALEPLVDYFRRVSGEHDDWDEFRAAMQRERRVLLRITLTEAAGVGV